MISFFVLLISMRIVYADYQCLCNYSVEKPVYAATSTSSTRLGYLYEFDCKPLAEHQSSNADVIAVQFLTQVGYVYIDPQTREETCPGNPSVLDLVSGRVDLCPNRSNRSLAYFRQYGHLCYELRPGVKDWRSAETDCEQNGGTLVVIHDSVTQQRIMSMINDLRYNHPLWIGLYDMRTEGIWEWIDGQTLGAFSNWDPGHRHPVYHNERDCALMDNQSGRWTEAECWGFILTMQRNSWICQYNLP